MKEKLALEMAKLWKKNINDAKSYFKNSNRHAKNMLKTTMIMLNIMEKITIIIIKITSIMLKNKIRNSNDNDKNNNKMQKIILQTAMKIMNMMLKITITLLKKW